MSNYDDMRDFQMREQYGDDYITPTRAYTGADLAEFEEDHGPEWREIFDEVVDRDMARHESQRVAQLTRQIHHLQAILTAHDIDFDTE